MAEDFAAIVRKSLGWDNADEIVRHIEQAGFDDAVIDGLAGDAWGVDLYRVMPGSAAEGAIGAFCKAAAAYFEQADPDAAREELRTFASLFGSWDSRGRRLSVVPIKSIDASHARERWRLRTREIVDEVLTLILKLHFDLMPRHRDDVVTWLRRATAWNYVDVVAMDRALRLRVRADYDTAARLIAALAEEAGVPCKLTRGVDVEGRDWPEFGDDRKDFDRDDEESAEHFE